MFSSLKLPDNEIGHALSEFRSAFRSVGVFSAVINLLMIVPSLYMLQVYDRVLSSRNETTLLMLTLMVLGAYPLHERAGTGAQLRVDPRGGTSST